MFLVSKAQMYVVVVFPINKNVQNDLINKSRKVTLNCIFCTRFDKIIEFICSGFNKYYIQKNQIHLDQLHLLHMEQQKLIVNEMIPEEIPMLSHQDQLILLQSKEDIKATQFNAMQPQVQIVAQIYAEKSSNTQTSTSSVQLNHSPNLNNLQVPKPHLSIASTAHSQKEKPTYQKQKKVQLFNDDELLILEKLQKQVAKEQMNEGKIEIEIKAQRSMIKLNEALTLPAMCSIKTSGGSRSNVDLICVIDVSGSMEGEKIKLVKETMNFLIQTMTPSDRISIITFNGSGRRICGLKCVTPQNIISFHNHIHEMFASGGTSIIEGLNIALKTIRDRKQQNQVTSVFLLSDGQDRGAEDSFRHALNQPEHQKIGVFSIHSFGFGLDHDQNLMVKICQMKNGNFYFIKELGSLDQAFCNALGGIISMIASEVHLKIRLISQGLMEGVKISRVYGPMWSTQSEKQYSIKITQLMSGITKDFVFELTIPIIEAKVEDLQRNHNIISGIFEAINVNGKNVAGQCYFTINLLNEEEEIFEINQNVDVIENYLRVQAAQAIKENMKKADENHFGEAQNGIDEMIEKVQSNKKARKEKMEIIVNDLKFMKGKLSQKEYGSEIKKTMLSAHYSHTIQGSSQTYSSPTQTRMVEQLLKSKRSQN